MRKLTADFILHPNGSLVANHSLCVDDQGMILDLLDYTEPDCEYHQGILCPGFVNTHCHLELSHLQNKIPQRKGLDGFIRDFINARKMHSTAIQEQATETDKKMWDEGIQAVGDICNTTDTFEIKKHSPIRYHSFIELFNFQPMEAEITFTAGVDRYHAAIISHQRASIVPHAPYSVPPNLFNLIAANHKTNNSPWCIHNQESLAENELFQNGRGTLSECFQSMGIEMNWLVPCGKNSLPAIRNYFPDNTNLLLVHNTYTSSQDIDFLETENILDHTWFSICAKANMYIENRLPDIPMLFERGCKITIGTDSLASNDSLSIIDELKTIHAAFPQVPVETLLTWATSNGAAYFEWNDLGTFRKNAIPGVILISNADSKGIRFDSAVTRII